MISNATFKDDEYGFFLNGKFNGFVYDVAATNVNQVAIVSQSDVHGRMLIDLDTVTLQDKDGDEITPTDTQEKASVLSGIVSKKKSIVNSPCSLLNSAVLNLTTIGDVWTDAINGNDFSLLSSNAFEFNGTDNYVDLGVRHVGGTLFEYESVINGSIDNKYFVYCGGDNPLNKGFRARINYSLNQILVFTADGSVSDFYTFQFISIPANTDNLITINWSGVSGENMTISVNDESKANAIAEQWTDDSFMNVQLFGYSAVKMACKSSYVIYNGKLIPFSIGESNKVYDVNSDIELTILGTVTATNWITQDNYHYNLTNGFNIVGTAKIPASQLNIGKDILGNDLSNPAISNGHNAAETYIQAPDVQLLKDNDTANILFDAGGNALKLAFSDIVNGGRFYNNTVSQAQKQQLVLFGRDLTIDEERKKDICYLKSNTLPDGYSWLTDDSGNYLTDSNGEYIYE